MSARVVCISRELGADGERVGRLVAEQLGLQYVDEEVIARAAERGGVEPSALADAEQRKPRLLRVLELIGDSGGSSGYIGPESSAIRSAREESHRDLIRAVIEEIAGEGNAVIVAHAASMALTGRDGVLRVMLTAPPEIRIRRIAEAEGADDRQAAKLVRDGDAARAAYVKRFYSIDRELPTHYDLVVNTGTLAAERAAEVIAHAAGVAGEAE